MKKNNMKRRFLLITVLFFLMIPKLVFCGTGAEDHFKFLQYINSFFKNESFQKKHIIYPLKKKECLYNFKTERSDCHTVNHFNHIKEWMFLEFGMGNLTCKYTIVTLNPKTDHIIKKMVFFEEDSDYNYIFYFKYRNQNWYLYELETHSF